MKKAVLFDLDGTLVNTLDDIADSANAVLAAHGYATHAVDAYRQFIGNGAKLLMKRAAGVACEEEINALFSEFVEHYQRHCLDKAHPYDGVLSVLDDFLEKGIRLGVVTNKPHAQAIKIVKQLFGERFSCVYGAQDAYPRKPDPVVMHMAMQELQVESQDCIYVGDSDVDVYTAHAASMPCIGCAFGFRGKDELIAAGADALVDGFKEISKNRLIFP